MKCQFLWIYLLFASVNFLQSRFEPTTPTTVSIDQQKSPSLLSDGPSPSNGNNGQSLPDFNYSYRYRGSKSKLWPWHKDKNCFTTLLSNQSSACEPPYLDGAATFCFGAQIQYTHTSLSAFVGPEEQTRGFSTLQALSVNFSGLPGCWLLFKELVCSIQYAPCATVNASHHKAKLASRNLCLRAREKCHFLHQSPPPGLWPVDILDCHHPAMFSGGDSCTSAVDKQESLEFDQSDDHQCLYPLMRSDFQPGWHSIPKCGQNCTSHWLKPSEHDSLASFVRSLLISSALMTGLAWLAVVVNLKTGPYVKPKSANFPDMPTELNRPLAWYLFCQLLIILCWSLSLVPGWRQILTCRPDGTLRTHELAREQNYLCVVQFFLLYCAILGASIWLTVFSCQFHLFCVMPRPKLHQLFKNGKMSSWLQLTWTMPVVLIIYPLCAGFVEADGISGFCFIGYSQPMLTIGFVFVPVSMLFVLSLVLVASGVLARKFCRQNVLNTAGFYDPREFMGTMKLLIFYLVPALALGSAWAIQILHYTNMWPQRQRAFVDFLQCQLRKSVRKVQIGSQGLLEQEQCELKHRPDIRLIHLHIFCFFLCTLTADVCLLTMRRNYRLWFRLVDWIYRLFRTRFQKRSLSVARRGAGSVAMSDHPDEPKTTTDEEIPLNSMLPDSGAPTYSNTTDQKAATDSESEIRPKESQHSFRKRLVNRAREYRKRATNTVTRSSATATVTSRTPSSLRSTSLSSALNCSSVELPFPSSSATQTTESQAKIRYQAFLANMAAANFGYPSFYPAVPVLPAPPSGMFYQQPHFSPSNTSFGTMENGQPMAAAFCHPFMMQFFQNNLQQMWPQGPMVPSGYSNPQSTTEQTVKQQEEQQPTPGNEAEEKNLDAFSTSESSCDSDEADLIDAQFKGSESSLNR